MPGENEPALRSLSKALMDRLPARPGRGQVTASCIIPAPTMRHTKSPRPALQTLTWVWMVAAMLLLKGAVPLLAVVAADKRGVAVADVWSVYGVKTTRADVGPSAPSGQDEPSSPGQHAGETHCALSTLLGSAPFAMPAAAVHHPVPRQAGGPLEPLLRAPPVDPRHRWLARRMHAPPVSA